MKKAFTIAEALMAILIIGFLGVISLNSLSDLQPNKEMVLFKKAYSVAERAVGELINDESIYPYDPNNIGFRNVREACIEGTETCFSGRDKFLQFFARKLSIVGNPQSFAENFQFTTPDGVKWAIFGSFCDGTSVVSCAGVPTLEPREYSLIMVDVNGDKGPNLPQAPRGGNTFFQLSQIRNQPRADLESDIFDYTTQLMGTENRDRFFFIVDFDGRVRVTEGSIEAGFLGSHDSKKTDEEVIREIRGL